LASGFLNNTDRFVIDVKIKPGDKITVYIDGDTPVTIDDCVALSRHIESQFDRDVEDFELSVTSYGADKPLENHRQYKKHIGRELEVHTTDDVQIIGKLTGVDKDKIIIQPGKGKKKKELVVEPMEIRFDEIEKANVVLAFK